MIIARLVPGQTIGDVATWIESGPNGGRIVMMSRLGIASALIGGAIAWAAGLESLQRFSAGGHPNHRTGRGAAAGDLAHDRSLTLGGWIRIAGAGRTCCSH